MLAPVVPNQRFCNRALGALIRPSRSFANVCGLRSPAKIASMIARPVTPVISLDDVVQLQVHLIQTPLVAVGHDSTPSAPDQSR